MSKPRVLVVEDNPSVRELTAAVLEEWFDVSEASNGQEGLEQVLADGPDAVVTDHSMPVMDGATLVKELRARPEFDAMPIIVASGNFSQSRSDEVGANGYFAKPFDFEKLAKTILVQLG